MERQFSDLTYYLAREREERALAERTRDPELRAVHLTLADQFAEMAEQEIILAHPNPGWPI